jgi:hypothetical protein
MPSAAARRFKYDRLTDVSCTLGAEPLFDSVHEEVEPHQFLIASECVQPGDDRQLHDSLGEREESDPACSMWALTISTSGRWNSSLSTL